MIRQYSGTHPGFQWLEHLTPSSQHVVQRFLEVRRRLSELPPDLLHVFLVTLLDLVAEQLLQGSSLQAFIALRRMVGHHVGDERSREPPGLLVRVVRQERIDRLPLYD